PPARLVDGRPPRRRPGLRRPGRRRGHPRPIPDARDHLPNRPRGRAQADRRVWSMGALHDAALVCDALDAAVATRGRSPMPETIFHTDRGAEYSSTACLAASQRLGGGRPHDRTGSCLDNAVAESWFASLKVELVHRQHYRTRAEARTAIFASIAWYHRSRLHS